ncbi:MAG: aspartate/glutamate racemase family protein [Clostridia bacterium]|nr:aspartate/glutamate racemase family protein [Clostridia bacterium]
MIGIFDSGSGGEFTQEALKRAFPSADTLLYSDRKNAPFGTKTEKELIKITKDGITRLTDRGADVVLLACCTASTVHHLLPDAERERSIPIIGAVAKEALSLTEGRIAVLATEATVRSHAFKKALGDRCAIEIAASELVGMVERGEADGSATAEAEYFLRLRLSALEGVGCDALILGCTHFPRLGGTIIGIAEEISKRKIIAVSSTDCAVKELLQRLGGAPVGEGRHRTI